MVRGRISDPSKRTDVSPASSKERLQMEVVAEVRLQLQDTGHERVHLRRLGNLEEFYEAGLAGAVPHGTRMGKRPTA